MTDSFSPSMTPRRRYLPGILVLMMGVSLAGCHHDAPPPTAQPVEVGVVTLQEQAVPLTTDLPGRVTGVRTAEVRPQVSGVILHRLFTEGTDVKQGQQLYQIDPAAYQAVYDKAAAALASAQALAKRYKPLADARAVSRQQYDDAVAAEREAAADVESARVNLTYTKVLSPISGRIGRSNVTEGALVTNGQSTLMATVQQLDPIYVDVTQSTTDLLRLRRELSSGQLHTVGDGKAQTKLTLEDGSSYPSEGTLQFSEVTVDQGTGMVTLRAQFPNPDKLLLPGMFVHGLLEEGVRPAGLLIPQAGVSRDEKGNAFVYVVKDDSVVEQRSITVDRMVAGSWLVNSGIKAGEKVITQGLLNVRPGVKVKASPAQSSSASVTDHMSTNDPTAQ